MSKWGGFDDVYGVEVESLDGLRIPAAVDSGLGNVREDGVV
jgi:hypothetical protein